MALTKKDLEMVSEMIAQSRPGAVTKDIIDAQIKIIEKQVSINTQIMNEIQSIGENIKEQGENSYKILNKLSNGISSGVNEIHEVLINKDNPLVKIVDIYNDVSSKDGYFPKLAGNLKMLWISIGTVGLGFIGNLLYNWLSNIG